MAHCPRRTAKRPTPRPARRPSAGAPANASLPALARRLEREGPQARSARQRRVRDAVAAAAAEIRQRVDDGHELWRAATGEPMPLDPGDMKAAAVRFGLPADVVHRGDFTIADVTNFMLGKRQAAADDMLDRARAIQAEAVVRLAAGNVTPGTATPADTQAEAADDEYAWAAEHFDRTDWRILEVCVERRFTDRASAQPTHRITQFVAGTGGRPAKGECGDLRRHYDFLRDRGFLSCRRGVGTFATQKAIAVCKARNAERTPEVRMVSQE